jgi:hypothetical protein
MNSPFTKLYTAIIAHLQTNMPTLRYIAQDLGQIDFYEDTPPVSWPCLLMDIGDASFSDASHGMQLAEASVTLRLAHTTHCKCASWGLSTTR